jgi:hypothetical protein
MRRLSIAVVTVLGLSVSVTLMSRPAADMPAKADAFPQTSIVIDELPTNIKQLPFQSSDAF